MQVLLARMIETLALVATIVSGNVNIAVVLVALFILGTAETFADAASSTLLPGLVAREDLGIANARMQGAFLLTNQLLTPPIGAFLFAAGMALPFVRHAARWPAREDVRDHRAVLVRVRRFRAPRGRTLGAVRPHRPHKRRSARNGTSGRLTSRASIM